MTTNFGKYELIRKLATGGMADIWLARQTGMQGFEKPVVIKRILPHLSADQVFLKMFLDEGRMAACLNHPNIVQIYDLGCIDGQYFIAMEFVDGVDVATVLKAGRDRKTPLKLRFTLRIVSQACDGLHYAHFLTDMNGEKLNLVHRDVSPQNILLSYMGNVKVTDFGIAKARGRSTKTNTGTLKGKFGYMSPEQIKGSFVDQRSDVFSLGIVLWEMLTYRRLFKRENEAATIMAVAGDEIPSPKRYWPKLPEELEQITMKALERDVTRRYQSAQELGNALEQYLSSQGLGVVTSEISKFLDVLFPEKQLGARDHTSTSGLSAAVYRDSRSDSVSLPLITGVGKPISAPPAPSSVSDLPALVEPAPPAQSPVEEPSNALSRAVQGTLEQLDPPPPEPKPQDVDDDEFEMLGEPGEPPSSDSAPESPGMVPPVVVAAPRSGLPHMLLVVIPVLLAGLATSGYFIFGGGMKPAPSGSLQAPVKTEATAAPEPQRAGTTGAVEQVPAVQTPGEARPAAAPPEKGAPKKELKKEAAKIGVEAVKTRPPEKKSKEPAPPAGGEKQPQEAAPKAAAVAPAEDGFLNFDSEPWSEVWSAGSKLGDTPLANIRIPAGKVQLVLRNPELGFEKRLSVTIVPGETVSQNATVLKGVLNVNADLPSDVYLNNARIGATPLAGYEIFEGTYKLRLVNREKGIEKVIPLTIAPGKTKTISETLAR